MNRLEMIKQAAQKAKAKNLNTTVEAMEMKVLIKNMDARKKAAKVAAKMEMKLHKKLTSAVKKAGHQTAGSLDCFKEENMFYSEKETARYLEGTSYIESYNAMQCDQEWN